MTGASNAYTPIAAPPATPPRLGLLTSAARPDMGGGRWINGISFSPEACMAEGVWWWCPDTSGEGRPTGQAPSQPKGTDENPDVVQYRPWALHVDDTCSTFGFNVRDYQGRARRKLLANQSYQVEHELWTGETAQTAAFPNNWLTNSGSLTDLGTEPLIYALAALQEHLADVISGSRGMIHCTVRTATLWLSAGVIRREGNLLLDGFDNIIVAGSGYPGTGPDDEDPPVSLDRQWAYATSMVHYAEDDIVVVPGDFAEAVDRDTNTVTFRAERVVGAWWDGCAHAAVEVNLCEPCCTPSGS